MPLDNKTQQIYTTLQRGGADVGTEQEFNDYFFAKGDQGYKNRLEVWKALKGGGADVGKNYEEFRDWLGLRATKPATPAKASPAPSGNGIISRAASKLKGAVQAATVTPKPTAGLPIQPMEIDTRPYFMRKDEDVAIEQGRQAQTSSNPENIHVKAAMERGQQAEEKRQKTPTYTQDVDRALRGDKAAVQRTGLDKRMSQLRDQIDYAQATGEPLKPAAELPWNSLQQQTDAKGNPVYDKNGEPVMTSEHIFEAPTLARDEKGDVILGKDGKPLVGTTTDEGRVSAYAQSEEHAYNSDLSQALRDRDRLEQELDAETQKGLAWVDPFGKLHYKDKAQSDKVNTLMSAYKQAEDRIKALRTEQAGGNRGFWNGLVSAATDVDTYTFGLSSIGDTYELLRVSEKVKKGEALTDAERQLLRSTMGNQQAQSKLDESSNRMYRAGKMSFEMLPFMAQIMATGGFSGVAAVGSEAGARLAAAYARKYGEKALLNRINMGIIRGTGVALGDMAAGFASANTTGLLNTANEAMQRRIGQLGLDDDGNYEFTDDEDWWRAIMKAEASQTKEFATERFGEHLPNLREMNVWFAKRGAGARKISRALSGIAGTRAMQKTARWLRKGGINGVGGEILEEEIGLPVDVALGDQTWEEAFGGKTQGDIIGGMFLSVGAMHGLGLAGQGVGKAYKKVQYYKYKHRTDRADAAASSALSEEKWEPLKERIDNTSNDDIGTLMDSVLADKGYTKEEKRAVYDYMNALMMERGVNLGMMSEATSRLQAMEGEETEPSGTELGRPSSYQRNEVDGENGKQWSVTSFDSNGNVVGEQVFDSEDEAIAYEGEQKMIQQHQDFNDFLNMATDPTAQETSSSVDTYLSSIGVDHTSENYDKVIEEISDPNSELGQQFIQYKEDKARSNQAAIAQFEEEHGWEAGTVKWLSEQDPMELDNESLQMADEARAFLETLAYPPTEVHIEHSKEKGGEVGKAVVEQVVSEDSGISPEENAGRAIAESYKEAEDAYNALRERDYKIAQEIDSRLGTYSEQEIISSLDTFRPQDVQVVIDYFNAKARYEGYMEEASRQIDAVVKRNTDRRVFHGTINGEADDQDLISISDGENTYTLVSGNVTTDSNGNITDSDSGLVIGVDANGDLVSLSDKNLNVLPERVPLSEYEATERVRLEEAVTQVTDPNQTLMQEESGNNADVEASAKDTGGDEASATASAAEEAAGEPAGTGATQPGSIESVTDKDGIKRYENGIDVDEAISDIQNDGFDVNDIADASIGEAQETIDKINSKERKTRKDLVERKKAQDVIDYYTSLKERYAGSVEEPQATEPEGEPSGTVAETVEPQATPQAVAEAPEWRYDTPEAARERGYKVIEGHRVDRQEEKPMPQGMEVEVQYSTKDKVKGRLTVSELDDVQGSHLTNGQRNEKHFMPESQPKAEFGADRQTAAQTNASEENFRPELMLTFNGTQSAYSGSTSQTNRRREIIQGNGRRNLAEYIYAPGNEAVARKYKDFLKAHAEELGTTAEAIEQMEKPFAHIVLDVNDEEAIRLGQFTAQDLESGGKKVPEIATVTTKVGDKYSSLANIILAHEDPDASLSERIERNADDAIKWLNRGGYINNTESKTLLEDKALARQFIKDLITDQLFKDAHPDLRTMFYELPKNIQSAIISVVGREVAISDDKSILKDIQESIRAYHELNSTSPEFAGASGANFEKRYKAVESAVNDWLRQINMDGSRNTDKYSNFALRLAKLYKSLRDQKTLASRLREYYDLVSGSTRELGMFDEVSTGPLTREEAIKQVFGIDYGRQRTVPLAGDNQGSEERGEGSPGGTESREREPEGTRPSDDRGGDTGDAEIRPSGKPEGTVAQSREDYLASHPLTEAQIMADTEATEDEKLNAIDFLKGEDDSAISRFYYDSIFEREQKKAVDKIKEIAQRGKKQTKAQTTESQRDNKKWQYNLHYDRDTKRAWITRDDWTGGVPIEDGRFRIEGRSLAELRDILENPKNNLGDVYKQVEASLHNEEVLEQIREQNDPMAAIEKAASSFRGGKKKGDAVTTKLGEHGTLVVGGVPKREEQKAKDQQDIDDALKEFNDFLDNAKGSNVLDAFMRKGLEGNDKAQANLLDAFTLTNEAQRMFLKDLLRLASKVGYAYIKKGVHDAQAWSKQMTDSIGKKLKDVLGWDDAIVGEFVDEVWNQKYTVDGQRMRLSEHAERLKKNKGADTAVNVNKKENNEEEKPLSLQEETAGKPTDTVANLEGDSAEFAERQEKINNLREEIAKTLRRSSSINGSRLTFQYYKSLAKAEGIDDISDTDLQELVEAEIVNLAREISNGTNESEEQKYQHIVRLYENQPSLNARDNDRINLQQYSTPAPMAFLMGLFTKPAVNGRAQWQGLEPSAGNGMLTINLPKERMHVNDIDEMRLSNLQKQGFGEVTSQDGLQSFGEKQYDVIVTNPPFGNITPKVYDGLYEISGLEHQMAINALESMKDDGRAAIIIGGNTEYNTNGTIKGKDRVFLNYLYSHYNVVDVINMDGKTLYSRQGTGFPVRMILIDGRKAFDKNSFAPVQSKARADVVRSYDELYKRVEDDILSNENKPAGVHDTEGRESNGKHDNGHAEGTAQTGVRDVHAERGEGQHNVLGSNGQRIQLSEQPTNAEGQKPDGGRLDANGQRDTGLVPGTPVRDGVRGSSSTEPNRATSSRNDEGRDGGGQGKRMSSVGEVSELQPSGGANLSSGGGPRPSVEVRRLGAEKVPYRQQSKNPYSLQSQMPAEQADVVKKALEELGDVDEFLVKELGYSSVEDLHHGSQSPDNHGGLAAEQVDSVAMAIHQMNQGNAFIIGDQTGVGKGRQAAALIRYGVKKGGCPVFISVKKGLFSDMYRDLCDIGSPELRPFIWSADDDEHSADVTDKNGNVVFKRPSDKEQKRVVDYINKHGELPPEYDYIVTTYDSFKGGTMTYEEGKKQPRKFAKGKSATTGAINSQAKRDALERLAENSYVIMDESHNAGGETSAVSGYLQYITTRAKGVTFLSATFAKRPGNMPIYSLKTAISKAGVAVGELIDAVKRGGATFQEIMSKALTEAGQMIRRERDMTGVTIDWRGIEDEDVIQKQREQYDEVIGLFNDIINFQRTYVDPIVDNLNDQEADVQGSVDHTPGTRDMGINNTPFASRTYNMVQQVLLSLKAEETAKRAIEHLKAGRKPVIALANTNEGAADKAAGYSDESMEMPDLSVNLKKGLRGTLRITKKDAFGNSKNEEIPFERLSQEGQARYNEIMDAIDKASTGLSLSPIDVIKNELKKAGYKVGELTGRKAEFVYNEDGTVKRVKRADKDKKRIAADFNNGKLDALILNKSAGTGISLHASTKFDDQRQRIMIVAQAQGDVNDEVQIRGRIDRTGQVLRGMYEYVVSQIPSEQRLLMMLKSKLRSLDANTTSSQKSKFNEMQVQDIINKYGDDIVIQYLSEHPDLAVKMVDPLKWGESLGDGYENMPPETLVTNAKKQDEQGQTASKVLGRMALLTVKEQEKMLAEISELYQAEIDRLNEMGENDLEITEMPLKAKTLSKAVWEQGVDPDGNNPFADNTYVEKVSMDVLKKPMKAEEVKKSQERLLGGKTWEDFKKDTLAKVDEWAEQKKKETTETITARAEKKAKAEQEKYIKGAKKSQEKNGMTDEDIERNGQIQYNHFYDEEMKKLDNALVGIESQRQVFEVALDTFSTDGVYALPMNIYDLGSMTFEPGFGKLIDVKISSNYSPNSSTLTFATLDGRRKITVPINGRVKQQNNEKRELFPVITTLTAQARNGMFGSNVANTLKVLQQSVDNWDKLTSSAARKDGHIITGNLLKALVSTREQHVGGKLISYTTDTGEVRQGILMPDNFDPAGLTSKTPISAKKEELRYARDKVESADGEVVIKVTNDWDWSSRGYNTLELIVPKSKKKGEKYFNDKVLLGLMDDQFEGSSKLKAEFPRSNLDAVMKRLDELGVTVKEEKKDDTSGRRYDMDIEEGEETIEEDTSRLYDKYNSVPITGIYLNKISDRDLLTAILGFTGISLDDYTEEEISNAAKDLRDSFKKTRAYYNPISKEIVIFADNISKKWGVEKAFFHENIHAVLHKWYGDGSRRIADEFWDNTPEEVNGRSKDFIRNGYKDKEELTKREEWFVYNLTDAMLTGDFETIDNILSSRPDLLERVNNILKEIGYDREREQAERAEKNASRIGRGVQETNRTRSSERRGDSSSSQEQQRADRNSVRQEESNNHERIALHVDGLVEKLGTKGRTTVYHSFDELPEKDKAFVRNAERQGKKVRGWYENGRVFLYLPHIDSIYQAEKTIWHETVAHHGLRQLIGEENLNKLLTHLWLTHKDGDMGKWVTERMTRNGWSLNEAIEEYLAREAEKHPFEQPSLWQRVRWLVADAIRKIGFKSDPTISDIQYLLWLNQNRLNDNDPLMKMKQQAFVHRLERAAALQPHTQQEEDSRRKTDGRGGRRFDMDIDEPLEKSVKRVYEDTIDTKAYVFTEAFQDSMMALKVFQNSALKKGEEILDSQNAYMAENLMHGKSKNEMDLFNEEHRKGIEDIVNKILNKMGWGMREMNIYLMTKSGLERNRELYVRDWLEKERKKKIRQYEDLRAPERAIYDAKERRIEEDFDNGLIDSEEEKNQLLMRALVEAHEEYIDSIDNNWEREKTDAYLTFLADHDFAKYIDSLTQYIKRNVNAKYNPSKHDYSGLTEMYGDAEGKYDEQEIIDQLVEDETAMDEGSDPDVPDTWVLWHRINEANRYALERYREAGMRTDEQIDKIEQMFHFYVPMRGFDKDMGEDVYQYFTSKSTANSYVGGLIKQARGRKSMANSPLATMFAMAYKAIADCNQNWMKQHFYRFCQAHPNDLVVLDDAWMKLNEVTGEWQEVWPDIPEDASEEQVRAAVKSFDDEMRQLASEGKAKKIKGKGSFTYKPIDKRHKDEHTVDVMINGKKKLMTVVGNPRLAQALNGHTRWENGKNILSKMNASIKNKMSAAFTSYSPTFAMRNMLRDWTHFAAMLNTREGKGYTKAALNYYRETLPRPFHGKKRHGVDKGQRKVGMVELFRKYRDNTLDMSKEVERDFKDFMDNGGVTGYVHIQKLEKMEKELKKLAGERTSKGERLIDTLHLRKVAELNDKFWDALLGTIEAYNEAVENNARFATYRASRHYAGRTKARSAYDAKEITVNFNKKGSGHKIAGFKTDKKDVGLAAQTAGVTSQVVGEGKIFFNATIQAIANTFKGFKNPDGTLNKKYIGKWAVRYALPPFAFGLLLPYINQILVSLFGGDDDEYANLPEWTRRKNLCFYVGNGNFVTIPVGQELAAFLALGDIAASNLYAPDLKPVDKDWADEMEEVLSTFSPVDLGTKITNGGFMENPVSEVLGRTSSVLAPVIAVENNLSWTGRPIYREDRYENDEFNPEYQMVYRSTNPLLVAASKKLHELGGGNDRARGKEWSEVNPAIIQYLWEQYTGGPGKVFANTISMGKDAGDLIGQVARGEDIDTDFNMRKVEGPKAFFQQGDDRTQYYRVQAKYYKYEREANKFKHDHDLSALEKNAEIDVISHIELEELKKTPGYQRYEIIKNANHSSKREGKVGMDELRKEINATDDRKEKREKQKVYNELMRGYVEMLDGVVGER